MSTILSGDLRENVVEKIHSHLIEIGEQVRDNKVPMEDYLITKVRRKKIVSVIYQSFLLAKCFDVILPINPL